MCGYTLFYFVFFVVQSSPILTRPNYQIGQNKIYKDLWVEKLTNIPAVFNGLVGFRVADSALGSLSPGAAASIVMMLLQKSRGHNIGVGIQIWMIENREICEQVIRWVVSGFSISSLFVVSVIDDIHRANLKFLISWFNRSINSLLHNLPSLHILSTTADNLHKHHLHGIPLPGIRFVILYCIVGIN